MKMNDKLVSVEEFAAQFRVLVDVFAVRYPMYTKEDPQRFPSIQTPEQWIDAITKFARVAYLPDWPD